MKNELPVAICNRTGQEQNLKYFGKSSVYDAHGYQLLKLNQGGSGEITNNPVPNGTPLWGKEFKDKSLHYAHRTLTVGGYQSTLPRQHNYMDLDPTYTDAYGDPLLRITAKLTDQELNLGKAARKKYIEIM